MEIIDQIRQAADIVEIASLYTSLKKRGRKHVGLCPFHSEKDPSFTVDSEKQLFHCFGCGVGGDVFTLVMEKENLTFPEALNHLAERYHIPMPQKARLSPELQKLEEKVYKINELALAFFRRNLFRTREGQTALAYLKKRGLSSDTLEALKVGYALTSWNALLDHFRERGTEPSLLEKAGLVLPGQKRADYYDRFRGRIIFPIFGLTGKTVAFGGRAIAEATPKYLNSPDTPVYSKGKVLYGLNWTKEAVREAGELILVEGYTDFASLYQAGIRNAAASLGTALTPDQVYQAHRFAEKIVINYDGDHAGKAATSRGIPICFELGTQPEVLILPEDLDPDGFIRKYGAQSYGEIKQSRSVPLIKFMIDLLTPNQKAKSIDAKISTAKRIIDIILINPDTMAGSEYLKQLCDYMDLDERVVRSSIKRIGEKKAAGPAESFLYPAEKRLLQVLLENQGLAADLLRQVRREDFRGLRSEGAMVFILDCARRRKRVLLSELSTAVGPDLWRPISEMMQEKSRPGTPEEALDCLKTLRRTAIEAQLRALQKEVERCERNGEKEKLARLLSQKQDLTRQILTM
ncbi:MAG: DNA primase [Candidatus Aminicenantes bacterium]|nr:DNA primase [Candidatus Aminicenantes bacterium]